MITDNVQKTWSLKQDYAIKLSVVRDGSIREVSRGLQIGLDIVGKRMKKLNQRFRSTVKVIQKWLI